MKGDEEMHGIMRGMLEAQRANNRQHLESNRRLFWLGAILCAHVGTVGLMTVSEHIPQSATLGMGAILGATSFLTIIKMGRKVA